VAQSLSVLAGITNSFVPLKDFQSLSGWSGMAFKLWCFATGFFQSIAWKMRLTTWRLLLLTCEDIEMDLSQQSVSRLAGTWLLPWVFA